jgi:hypothetical protein
VEIVAENRIDENTLCLETARAKDAQNSNELVDWLSETFEKVFVSSPANAATYLTVRVGKAKEKPVEEPKKKGKKATADNQDS